MDTLYTELQRILDQHASEEARVAKQKNTEYAMMMSMSVDAVARLRALLKRIAVSERS
jgi:hypothetical protein